MVLTPDPLIRTKLRVPFVRADLVARPRLIDRLAGGLRGPLTLVTAPAGFGKTTLVAAGLTASRLPAAWLSLDAGDNSPTRFLGYLAAALQSAVETVGRDAALLLASSQPVPSEAVLTSLINDLDALPGDLVLVLDDYQFIIHPAVHAELAFLIEHQPSTLHLVIASRSDPHLPLARLRARGQLVELRSADLRFTDQEVAEFINQVMQLDLDEPALALLSERTEGWIAGLQMAALSLRDRDDATAFITAFSGTHRYILDYLLEEVLANQPEEIQLFLLQTSILERMSAGLCDAIIKDEGGREEKDEGGREEKDEGGREEKDEGGRMTNCPEGVPGDEDSLEAGVISSPSLHPSSFILQPSAFLLALLDRSNLFLVPLDDRREWYRYHHLFADLLRARLEHLHPGLAQRLHARAAAWLEREGMLVEAVNHALTAGDHDHAARMVEGNTTRLLAAGELSTLTGWIEALPDQVRRLRPWLGIHQAYAMAFAGRLAEVEPLLTQAEVALAQAGLPADEAREVEGSLAAVRAMLAAMTGRDDEAVRLAQHALRRLPETRLWDLAAACWALGYAQRSFGRLSEAQAAFERQVDLAQRMGNIWTLVTGLTDLAQVFRTQGRLDQARSLFEAALREAAQQGARGLGYIGRMEAGLAGVLYEQNELDAAARLLDDSIAHTRRWPNPNHMAFSYTLKARVLVARGDLAAAWTCLAAAFDITRAGPLTRLNRLLLETDLVRLWLKQRPAGRASAKPDALAAQAAQLADTWRGLFPAGGQALPQDEGEELIVAALARVHLAFGRPNDALNLLDRMIASTRSGGRTTALINALVLRALACRADPGQAEGSATACAAFEPLEDALRLAQPAGFQRVFLDEGAPLRALLAAWLDHATPGPLHAYASHLLAVWPDKPAQPPAPPAQTHAVNNLVEPLSAREIEVLALLARGLTNPQIAARLMIAPGTVKAHTATIYRKLDVENRTQAVTRARELGMLR